MTIPKDLRAKAEAAREVSTTGWEVIERMYGLEIVDANNNEISVCYEAEVSSYIAAASPDVVISLLDEIERLREALRPFARVCEKVERFIQARVEQGGSPVLSMKDFRLSDFQNARAAITTGDKP